MSMRYRCMTAISIGLLLAFMAISLPVAGSGPAKALSVIVDTTADRSDEAQAIVEYLRDVGVSAEVRVWEWSALKERILAGERQMYLTDWGSAYFDPFDLAVPKLKTGDRGNYSFYSNPRFDAALDAALATRDSEARRRAYFEAQEILWADVPWVFGYSLLEIEAARADVLDWQPSMDSRMNLHDVGLKRGDTIVVGMAADGILTLDPAGMRDRATETVIRNMFDGLVTRTVDGRVVSEIAESWAWCRDTEYVFNIRQGIKFHNGDALTADDVVFSFDRVIEMEPWEAEPRLRDFLALAAVEKVDSHTVKFELSSPFPVLLQALVHVQIVPMNYVLNVGDDRFARKPVGCGPFKFVEGRLDDKVVMERFDGYYGARPI